MPKITKILLIAVLVLAVMTPLSTYVYINLIRDDAPDRLTFETSTTVPVAGGATSSSTSTTPPALPETLDGTWAVSSNSQVGYRVKERLFGQDTEAVGRTSSVSGTLTYSGQSVTAANLEVDMASVKSDQSNRDNQFRTRIMDTEQFPKAEFALTSVIQLPRRPDATPMTVKAAGMLTLRGVAQPVTADLQVRQDGAAIEVNGSIPIVFAQWQIPNPSFGPAETEDNGELELLVRFQHS